MIGNLRLTRSERARRERRKWLIRAIGFWGMATILISISVGLSISDGSYTPIGTTEGAEAAEGAGQTETADTAESPPAEPPVADELAPAEEPIPPDWASYYVETNTLVPLHAEASEASDIVGSLRPGSFVYGFSYEEGWVCVVDSNDGAYYVKADYVTPFSKDLSEVSVFLDSPEVIGSQFNENSNMNSLSGMTLEDITFLLQGYPALQEIGEPSLLYEKVYGVNAYFTLSVASHESAYGKSALAIRKNNLFGIGAYDEQSFESALVFSTKAESVEYFCSLMTGYRENGRITPATINVKYATDGMWANRVVWLMNSFAAQVDQKRSGTQAEA